MCIRDRSTDAGINQLAATIFPLLIQHERGEILTNRVLGSQYTQMSAALQGRRGEGYIRAVSDLMADSLGTWPYIIEHQAHSLLDFWLAGLQGIRESLLTPTAFHQQLIHSDQPLNVLADHIEHEQHRWQQVSKALLQRFQQEGASFDFKSVIEQAAYHADSNQ